MIHLTKKVFRLTGIATLFAGLSFGQVFAPATCAASAAATIIRAEGTTEQVSPLTITCTAPAGSASPAGTVSLQVFLTPSLPVTSKVLSSTSGASEAVVTVYDTTGAALVAQTAGTYSSGTQLSATVSGSTLNFTGIVVPALAAAGNTYTITVDNVRVDATSLSVGSTVSERAFLSDSHGSVVPAALAPTAVAFVQNGLAPVSLFKRFTTAVAGDFPKVVGATAGANSYVICSVGDPQTDAVDYSHALPGSGPGKSLAFVVRVGENFSAAFHAAAQEASHVSTTLASNSVTGGTRVALNFTNVPSGVTLLVPVDSIATSTSGAVLRVNSLTANTDDAVTMGTGLTGGRGLAAVPISGGEGTAEFEIVTEDAHGMDRFDIPVFVVYSANSVEGSSAPISVSANFGSVSADAIPNFVVGSSTNTVGGGTFSVCSTSLLFPFVTNQAGFDTTLLISNTSSDPFGSNGATAQAGTCSLNFYGTGGPSPANVTTSDVASGTSYVQLLSNVAAGFQGYMIAQCNFQYAHGGAFLTNGLGLGGRLSAGYFAGVIPDTNQKSRTADPFSAAGAGTGEMLGN